MKFKNYQLLKTFLLLFVLAITSCSKSDETSTIESTCPDTNCANYSSHAAAQADFDANPDCRADLDGDKDGIPCEELINVVKICTTTTNCGCSGKTKNQCGLDPCCKWIVGTGCKCS